jgi:hypothetical protein
VISICNTCLKNKIGFPQERRNNEKRGKKERKKELTCSIIQLIKCCLPISVSITLRKYIPASIRSCLSVFFNFLKVLVDNFEHNSDFSRKEARRASGSESS